MRLFPARQGLDEGVRGTREIPSGRKKLHDQFPGVRGCDRVDVSGG